MPTPKVVGTDAENRAAMTAHFHEQSAFYGEQVIINLINQKKYEGVLEQAFRQLTSSLGQADVHYEAFDFHKECSKMRYDRLVLLKDQLSQYAFGYFQKTKGAVNLTQVRTEAIPALYDNTLSVLFLLRVASFAPTAWTAWIAPM